MGGETQTETETLNLNGINFHHDFGTAKQNVKSNRGFKIHLTLAISATLACIASKELIW
jgi:hypothetical protein